MLPWERLVRLVPGDRIDVPPDALDAVRVDGIGGARLSQGRLGRTDGMRAIRLRLPRGGAALPDPLGPSPEQLLEADPAAAEPSAEA